jgi:glycine/D-amino acid oxidase-like deaminating enzyme
LRKADVVVIGGGIVGIACARVLQRAGRQVVVIEAGEIGRGCSFGNAGLIAVDHIQPLARPEMLLDAFGMLTDPLGPLHLRWTSLPSLLPWLTCFALAARPSKVKQGTQILAMLLREAVGAWKRLVTDPGEQLLRHQGYLTLFETAKAAKAAERESQLLRQHSIRFEPVSASDIRTMCPALKRDVHVGRFYPDAIYTTDPFELVQSLYRSFVADGGTVIEGQRVREILTEGGAAVGLKLPDSELSASSIILAAGSGAPELIRPLGVKAPLTSERGYHVMVDEREIALNLPLLFAERGFVATPMAAGLRLAGTVELGARAPDWKRADILRRHAEELFDCPGLTERSRWFGDRPTLPDYLPMIGVVPGYRNVILAFGHQHLGLTLAAVTAELVSEILQTGAPRLDISALSASRFA